jgi:hypothetical protein
VVIASQIVGIREELEASIALYNDPEQPYSGSPGIGAKRDTAAIPEPVGADFGGLGTALITGIAERPGTILAQGACDSLLGILYE